MMDTSLKEFEQLLAKRDYLFHIHTNYTDGLSTVKDYFSYAADNHIRTIIFAEHVRKKLSYKFEALLHDIDHAKRLFPDIKPIVGVEAKVLPGGNLDIPEEILGEIQVICFACHAFPDNLSLYKESLYSLFLAEEWKKYIRVWVHPGRFCSKRPLLAQCTDVLEELARLAVSSGIFLEKNLKEPDHVPGDIYAERVIVGYDAHSVNDLVQYRP